MVKNPFSQLDSTLSPESVQHIIAHFGDVADKLKSLWNGLTPQERQVIISSAEDVGLKLLMGGVSAAMTGDMSSVVDKLGKTLGKSSALSAIFEALKARG